MAAFHSMANRLVTTPLRQDRYNTEREYIIELGRINGYPRKTIENIIKKHEHKQQQIESSILFETDENSDVKRVVFPYFPEVTNRLSRTYHGNGYEMVNCNEYTLQKYMGSAKDGIPELLKSGIYEISCQEGCDSAYYGMTERNPTIRFGEHMECVTSMSHRSGVAKHLLNENHETDLSKVKLIQPINSRNTRVFECYEKLHIIKNKRTKQLMNLNDGNINSMLFDLV